MRKKRRLSIVLFLAPALLFAQSRNIDSLKQLLAKHQQQDTIRVILLNKLTREQSVLGVPETLTTGAAALELSKKLQYVPGEILAVSRIGNYHQNHGEYEKALQMFQLEEQFAASIADSTSLAWAAVEKGSVYQSQSNYPLALQLYLRAITLFEKKGSEKEAASVIGNVGVLYQDMQEPATAQKYYEEGLRIQEKYGDKKEIARFLNNLGGVYQDQFLLNRAESTYTRALGISEEIEDEQNIALILRNLMDVKASQKQYSQSFAYGFRSLSLFRKLDDAGGIADITYLIANTYLNTGKPDSAVIFAGSSLALAKQVGFLRNIYNTYDVLAKASAMKKEFAKAYRYQQLFIVYKDSLNGEDRKNVMAGVKFQYELDKKQSQIAILTKDKLIKEQEANRQRLKAYASLICLVLVGALSIVLVRSNQRKRKDNALLTSQKAAIEATLSELESTQLQLIHREKMASLGELTAGIAHEIQNPLNFVNNFSDINTELIDELKNELLSGNRQEALTLANDIRANEVKINKHGKRAESIVTGMLEHSRTSAGNKQPVDINALAEEYIRLSYHGLRAKDKSFTATYKTDFDTNLGKIVVMSQDIGRVLLNLFNNAFYAVAEKKKNGPNGEMNNNYQPEVIVRTRKVGVNEAQIIVSDNGNGIPKSVLNKVFQPFFTTKPTGQGTGLGLSLSYDIVHAHRGEISVDTREGQGTSFIIRLPIV